MQNCGAAALPLFNMDGTMTVDVPAKSSTMQATMAVTQDFYRDWSSGQLKTTRLVPIIASGNVNDKLTYVLASIATSYDGADLLSGSLNVTDFQFGITPSPATRYPTPTNAPTLAPTAAKDYNSRQPTFNPTYETPKCTRASYHPRTHARTRAHAHKGSCRLRGVRLTRELPHTLACTHARTPTLARRRAPAHARATGSCRLRGVRLRRWRLLIPPC